MQLLMSEPSKPLAEETLNSPSERALRTAMCYRNTMRNRLIRWLGGYDPIAVGCLMYRAGLLTNLQQYARYNPSTQKVVESQVKGIHKAILKLDPVYGIVRGYAHEK